MTLRKWTAAALAVTLSAATPGLAKFAPRPDLGVAALDANSGALLWEAWQADDVPAQAPADVRQAAMKLLSAKPEGPPAPQEGILLSDWPARLGRSHAVQAEQRGQECVLTLHEWTDDRVGKEIARATVPALHGEPTGVFGDLLVLKTRENTLYAFGASDPRGQWKPAWTFDILLKVPAQAKDRFFYHHTTLAVRDGLLWLATPDRLAALDKEGHARFDLAFANPLGAAWEAPPPRIVFRKDRLYYVHSLAVVAVGRAAQKEVWRHHTTRYPYLSDMAETSGLMLVQVGSDCPRTLANTLEGSSTAEFRLNKITPGRVAAAGVLLKAYGDGYPRLAVRRMIDKYKASEDTDGQKAVASMEQTLKDWPAHRDRARLAQACVDALAARPSATQPWGQPSSERLLTWAVLQEMLFGSTPSVYGDAAVVFTEWRERSLGLPQAQRQLLLEHCRSTLENGLEAERPFAASLLLSDEVGARQVSDSDIEKLLARPEVGVWRWAATRLARDGKRARLIELARKRSLDERSAILWIMSARLPETVTPEEEDFWMDCLKADAPRAAYAIRGAWNTNRPVPTRFREPIVSYLEKEIAAPKVLVNSQAQYEMEACLDILDRWGQPGDAELLKKYLRHPCVTEGARDAGGGNYQKVKVYSTRQRVAAMLKRRGEAVPPDTVFSEPWR